MAQFDPFADPRTAGILGMGSALLEASGPSKLPITIGQAMGAGLQRGLLERSRAEEVATQKMLRETQAKKMQMEMAEEEAFKSVLNQLPPALRPWALMNRKAVSEFALQQMFPKQPKFTGAHPVQTPQGPRLAQAKDTGGFDVSELEPYEKPPADKGVWGQPFEMNGATVQQNSVTGEIRQAVGRAPQTRIDMPAAVTPVTVMRDGKPVVVDGRTGNVIGDAPPDKARQVSPTISKAIADEIEEVGIAASTEADLGAIRQQIESGQIKLGPVNNLISQARNFAGVSNEQSRNFQSLKATLEKLRNDSLRLNKGVQTEGDAQRAWNELLANITDENVVKQRLAEIQAINKRAIEIRKLKIESLKASQGMDAEAVGQRAAQQPAAVGQKTGSPLPPKGQPLVKGTVYQTSRGPAKWDGIQFVQGD